MYTSARGCVRINGPFSDDFLVQVVLHQGSVLNPLLFTIVLEALSRETRSGYPEELLYIDDLALVCGTEREIKNLEVKWVESKC